MFSLPTTSDAQRVENLWDRLNFVDRQTPGIETYSTSVAPGDVLRWGLSWCASDSDRLWEILGPLTVSFTVDGNPVADGVILEAAPDASGRWKCRYWLTLLSIRSRGQL